MEPTQADLATYVRDLKSRRAAERLSTVLENAGLLEVSAAVAGGASIEKRIVSAPRWNDKQTREAFAVYLEMLSRDIWLSSAFSIAYVLLIGTLSTLVAFIAIQLINRQVSYRQLAGLPLPLLIHLLFKALRHERDNYRKMRADHLRALRMRFTGEASAVQ
jgi:hypothetical protein